MAERNFFAAQCLAFLDSLCHPFFVVLVVRLSGVIETGSVGLESGFGAFDRQAVRC